LLKRISLALILLAAVGASTALGSGAGRTYSWHLTPTGTTASFRGVSAISAKVAWTSGSLGTVLRTVDGGATWQNVSPPGASTLQFRDIEAFDADHAVILSIGNGTDSRVYVTSDAGQQWTQTFTNTDPAAFYDCMTFFDARRGLALSDPVDGRFRIIATNDGGHTWHPSGSTMPAALPNEFAFAASGQCLVTDHGRRAWFASGGDVQARVFRSDDGGQSWTVSATPIDSGPSAGIFALAFRGQQHGFAVGGDFNTPTVAPDSLALTADGGSSWHLVSNAPNEYRSGAAWVTGRDAVVVGPTGSNVSLDGGRTWQKFDGGSFNTVDCAYRGACWAAGAQGRAAHLVIAH
jgi:photosystem II stability/assembly factor-like uncharacterized protein